MQEDFNPKVSIVIPVYNGSNYMREAIDSALAQTYKNIEIIVVNDGSDDGGKTEEIALAYGNKIKYYFKDNGGTASAFNYGIVRMSGDFFCWLSHDDIFLKHKIKEQVSFLQDSKIKICYSKVYIIDEQGHITREDNSPWYPRMVAIKKIIQANYINGCSIMIASECCKEVGLFNEELKYTQDTEMWIRLLSKYEIKLIDKYLIKYRSYDDSRTKRDRLFIVEEEKQMVNDIFDKIVIDTLYTHSSKEIDYNIFKAKAFNWIGDCMSSKRYWFDFADQYYKKSSMTWRSLYNPAHIKLILGSQVVSIPSRLRRRVATAFTH